MATADQQVLPARFFSAWIFPEKMHTLSNICFQQKGRIGM
jgi:hypothetical protein